MARYEVPFSGSFKMRRSLIPVLVVIHSSFVSTIVSRILLVKTYSGTYLPTAVIAAVILLIKYYFMHWNSVNYHPFQTRKVLNLLNTAVQIKAFLALFQLKTKNSHNVRVRATFRRLQAIMPLPLQCCQLVPVHGSKVYLRASELCGTNVPLR